MPQVAVIKRIPLYCLWNLSSLPACPLVLPEVLFLDTVMATVIAEDQSRPIMMSLLR